MVTVEVKHSNARLHMQRVSGSSKYSVCGIYHRTRLGDNLD